MVDAQASILVRDCEQIRVSDRIALVRLSYRLEGMSREAGRAAGEPKLVIGLGEQARHLAPIPAPQGHSDVRRVAFAVACDVLDARPVMWLQFADGVTVDLPEPTPGRARAEVDGDGGEPRAPEDRERRLSDPERISRQSERLARLRDQVRRLTDAHAEAERQLVSEAAERAQAEDALAVLRRRLDEVVAEAETTSSRLRRRNAELENQLADALAELSAVTRAEQEASREARRLRDEVDSQAARLRHLEPHPTV